MWTAHLEDYAAYHLAAAASEGTIKLRLHYLRNLAALHPEGPWSVTLEDLVRFVGNNDWSAETRKCARGSVRSFLHLGAPD